jgi:hypothetical protein
LFSLPSGLHPGYFDDGVGSSEMDMIVVGFDGLVILDAPAFFATLNLGVSRCCYGCYQGPLQFRVPISAILDDSQRRAH